MRREIHVDSDLNFTDIISVLISKLKWLICIFLVGCVFGGVFGVWRTYDQDVYGTSLVFFVNPSDDEKEEETGGVYGAYGKTLMETMMQFLSTEVFAEKLMTGMPDAPTQKTDENGNLNAAYKYYISKVRNSLTFTCSNSASSDTLNTEITASSFVYVKISVLGEQNKEFAKALLSRIETEVPKEIEKEIHVPTGYTGTACRLMTVDDEIKLLNPGYTKSTAIRYAILLGFASLLVAAVTVILIERADKRLKNLDFITKKLDLPILAVVPSINMEDSDETEVK